MQRMITEKVAEKFCPGSESKGAAARFKSDHWLHFAAGVILLLFGASHFAFLRLEDPNHQLLNTVFPFIKNRDLYLFAAWVETITGIVCFVDCGRKRTNLLIITFVGVIIWYRWAFYYTGGSHCGCLGLLGRLLHLTKAAEKVIPIAALVLLLLCTSPWLWQNLRRLFLSRKTVVVVFSILVLHESHATQVVRVEGTIDLQEYNPNTGVPYPNQQSHSLFVAMLAENAWRVSVTNRDRPRYSATFVYDGTNTYALTPFDAALTLPFSAAAHQSNISETNIQKAVIEPSNRLIPHHGDRMGLSIWWLTYGLRPYLVKTNKKGLLEIPMPAASPRRNPGAFGYKWIIKSSLDHRFVESCEIVRDHSLDLKDTEELLRPEMDYPETLREYNQYMLDLSNRKGTASGFVLARYRCSDWFRSNDVVVPSASKYEAYMHPVQRLPWRVVEVKASTIVVTEQSGSLLPEISAPTRVIDYRYKKASNSRIFKYADYTLRAGDVWRSDRDPVLLAQADEWLRHGRKYRDFAGTGRVWAAWLLLVLLLAPLLISISLKKLKTKSQNI